jgi:hypothetical protein
MGDAGRMGSADQLVLVEMLGRVWGSLMLRPYVLAFSPSI